MNLPRASMAYMQKPVVGNGPLTLNIGSGTRKSVFSQGRISAMVEQHYGKNDLQDKPQWKDRRRTNLNTRMSILKSIGDVGKKFGMQPRGSTFTGRASVFGASPKARTKRAETLRLVTGVPLEVVNEVVDEDASVWILLITVISLFLMGLGYISWTLLIDLQMNIHGAMTWSLGEALMVTFGILVVLHYMVVYKDVSKDDFKMFKDHCIVGLMMGMNDYISSTGVSMVGGATTWMIGMCQIGINMCIQRIVFGDKPTSAMWGIGIVILVLGIQFNLEGLINPTDETSKNLPLGLVVTFCSCIWGVVMDLNNQYVGNIYGEENISKRCFFIYVWAFLGSIIIWVLNIAAGFEDISEGVFQGWTIIVPFMILAWITIFMNRLVAVSLSSALTLHVFYVALMVIITMLNVILFHIPFGPSDYIILLLLTITSIVFQLESPERDVVEELFDNTQLEDVMEESDGSISPNGLLIVPELRQRKSTNDKSG